MGVGSAALARSGSDSSGTHSNLECVGEDLVVANTGSKRIQFLYSLAMAQPVIFLNAGESRNLGTPGEDTGPPGTRYEAGYEEPAGSGFYYGIDEGRFPDCIDTPEEPENPTYSATAEIVCAGPQIQVNNTGTGHVLVWQEMTTDYQLVFAGESGLIPWVTDAAGNLEDPMYWDARRPGIGSPAPAGEGQFTLAELEESCAEVPPSASPTTTAPPTTGPGGSVVRNLSVLAGNGFVAPGSEIGPGVVTFGAIGFTPGEQVVVTLHSTPRALGTVTVDANGSVTITFEVLGRWCR